MAKLIGAYNLQAGRLMIEELLRLGVDYFCLSPGSRCTPLTVAVAEQSAVRKRVFHDERTAAFHALGYARATGRVAALICTSGTAAANYLSAVVEASMDMAPMILLTSDRPPELRDCGANQAIDQPGLYGRYVRWSFDLPCPDGDIPPEFILTTIDQAVHRARSTPPGPVHLNCMFREPFLPTSDADETVFNSAAMKAWRERSRPYTSYQQRSSELPNNQASEIVDIINSAACGLLVVGRPTDQAQRIEIERFARELGWPFLPDVLSGLRLGAKCDNVIAHHDLLFSKIDHWKLDHPSVLLHLGGPAVSERMMTFLKDAPFDNRVHVADHPFRHDRRHMVTHRFECSPAAFCDSLRPQLRTNQEFELKRQLLAAAAKAADVVRSTIDDDDTLTELGAARLVAQAVPSDHALFLASSLPIRLVDSFAPFTPQSVDRTPLVAGNRGASGIDGTVATAAGYAAGLERPVTLLIGDLALLHDFNSLSSVVPLNTPLTIVVLNNDGGGIFSLLPVAEREGIFEKYFATPHGLSFAAAAEQFGLAFHHPTTPDELAACYAGAVASGRSTLIEVVTRREDTSDLYRRLLDDVNQSIADS